MHPNLILKIHRFKQGNEFSKEISLLKLIEICNIENYATSAASNQRKPIIFF